MVGGHRYESLRFYLVGEAEGHRLGEGKAPRPDGTEEEDHRLQRDVSVGMSTSIRGSPLATGCV